MTLVYAFSLICELSFWFSIASYVGGIFTVIHALQSALCLFAGGFLSYLLRDQKDVLRMLPMSFSLIPIIVYPGIGNIIACIIPALYIAYISHKKLFVIDHGRLHDLFTASIFVLLSMFGVAYLLQHISIIVTHSLSWIIVYFGAMVTMLRMLRHDEKTIKDTRFKIVNMLVMTLVVVVGYFLSTDIFLSVVKTVINFIYEHGIKNIFLILGFIIGSIGSVFAWLLSLLKASDDTLPTITPESTGSPSEDPPGGEILQNQFDWTWLRDLLVFALIIVAVIVIIRAIKKMIDQRRLSSLGSGVTETRERISIEKAPPKPPRFAPSEPRAAVRWYYARFIKLCSENGIGVTQYLTTAQIESLARGTFDLDDLVSLRAMYLPARYHDKRSVPQDNVKAAKALLSALKRDLRQKN